MKFPYINEIAKAKEVTTYFQGLVRKPSCQEGCLNDEWNMTTEDFPLLSTRHHRSFGESLNNCLGFTYSGGLVWVDVVDGVAKLFIDGDPVSLTPALSVNTQKDIVRMGAYLCIFPDNVWFNTNTLQSGTMDAVKDLTNSNVTFQLVKADGTNINLWSGTGTPPDGAYKIDTVDNKTTLRVYSATTGMWVNVATTYMKISAQQIGANFKEGDGVKVTVDLTGISWAKASQIFVNDEGNNKRSNNFVIKSRDTGYIIVTALLDEASKSFSLPEIKVERKTPEMECVVECQNRLWGCQKEGHEIYASKLGDPTNWNCFGGISTDSWTATVGSDGEFTGAFAYMGYPIFFKEKSLLKVTISAYGAHSYKEIECRGVSKTNKKSLALLNELLYYASTDGFCVYDGNFPTKISDDLGVGRYLNTVSNSINDRWYVSTQRDGHKENLVYDSDKGFWAKEDDLDIKYFARLENDLAFVTSDNQVGYVYGTQGTKEGKFDWLIESGNIGYETNDKKYLSRLDLRMNLEFGTYAEAFINYDSTDTWIHLFALHGKGTRTFSIPVRPRRCDHFKIRIRGNGKATLYTLTKEYEKGSDV